MEIINGEENEHNQNNRKSMKRKKIIKKMI